MAHIRRQTGHTVSVETDKTPDTNRRHKPKALWVPKIWVFRWAVVEQPLIPALRRQR